MILEFTGRAAGDATESRQFPVSIPPTALRQVGADRRTGTTHLTGQSVSLLSREVRSRLVNITLDNKGRLAVIESIIEGRKAPQAIGGLPVISPPHTTQIEKARLVASNLRLDAETEALLSPKHVMG